MTIALTSSFDNAAPVEALVNATLVFWTDLTRTTVRFWSAGRLPTLYRLRAALHM